jgi:hypothetical protein
MDIINYYFKGLNFKHIQDKQNFAIYVAAIKTLLTEQQQYVIVFVPSHLAINQVANLAELSWQNLQTRLLPSKTYAILPQNWGPPKDAKNLDLILVERKDQHSIYECKTIEFPFEILMLHMAKKKSIYQYQENINLHWALNQFNTVLNYIGKIHPIVNINNNEQQVVQQQYNPLQNWMNPNVTDGSFEFI